jgi:carbon monoxide dehydrogenase subunit G
VPRYVATVQSPLSVEEAFAFLSDMRQYPSWDPSMSGARQVQGDGPGPDAEVVLEFGGVGPVRLGLRYAVVEYDPPGRMDIEASHNIFVHSYDRVTVVPSGDGCLATYDATFRMRGPLGPFDGLNTWWFRRLSDRAGAGLSHALGGTLVTT